MPDRAYEDWKIRIHGLVQHEASFSIRELAECFQVVTLPVTICCAGNRRKEQNVVRKSLGFSWGAGGGASRSLLLPNTLTLVWPQSRRRCGRASTLRTSSSTFAPCARGRNTSYSKVPTTCPRARTARRRSCPGPRTGSAACSLVSARLSLLTRYLRMRHPRISCAWCAHIRGTTGLAECMRGVEGAYVFIDCDVRRNG